MTRIDPNRPESTRVVSISQRPRDPPDPFNIQRSIQNQTIVQIRVRALAFFGRRFNHAAGFARIVEAEHQRSCEFVAAGQRHRRDSRW